MATTNSSIAEEDQAEAVEAPEVFFLFYINL